jgi:hypothetical protein
MRFLPFIRHTILKFIFQHFLNAIDNRQHYYQHQIDPVALTFLLAYK